MKAPKIITAYRILPDTNFKHEQSRVKKAVFFDFSKFMPFSPAKNLLSKTSAKFYGISPKETREKSLSVLLFCVHVDVIKAFCSLPDFIP